MPSSAAATVALACSRRRLPSCRLRRPTELTSSLFSSSVTLDPTVPSSTPLAPSSVLVAIICKSCNAVSLR